MLRTYLKTALRNLFRQKVVSLINIFCMAIAVSCSIIAYLFATDNVNTEWFHQRASNIFVVEHKAIEDGDLQIFGNSPAPLGPALLNDHSFVTRSTRIMYDIGTVVADGKDFEEVMQYADPSFLEMFTFPLAYGNTDVLMDKNAVVLSQSAAIRFFGTDNAIGKTLEFKTAHENVMFTVKGVAKEFIAPNSCVRFSVVTNFENLFRNNPVLLSDWNSFAAATFIEVDKPESIAKLASSMEPYIKLQNAADKTNLPIKSFVFQNLGELSGSDGVRNSIAGEVPMAPIIVLSAISIFLLLLASFNSININLAAVGARLKEIGIRKVIGGTKTQLIVQFLTENVLISLASLFVAVALTGSLLLPAFEEISGASLTLEVNRLDLWMYLLILFVVVGICSGLYPAFYISSFQPITILRDKVQFGGKNKFMRTLLTVQFVIAFITIITSVGLTLNYKDLQNRDWGYKKDNMLTFQVENVAQYNLMKKVALEQPTVSQITGAEKHVGSFSGGSQVQIGEAKTNAIVFEVGADYLEVLGFQVLSGKLPKAFDAVAVNEHFAQKAGWTNGVGEIITIDSVQYSVAAIVKDFHHDDFMREISSVVFRLEKEEALATMVLRIQEGTGTRTRAALEATWKKNFPESPITIAYQSDTFSQMYHESEGVLRIFIFTTVIALFMSCIGLFGLASQRVQSKRKEICIRKIFGVSLLRAVLLVNGNFLLLLCAAAVLATPLSYVMLNSLLDSIYIFRMEMNGTPFLIAYGLMAITILITLSGKFYQIAKANPASILKDE